jgi:glycerol-3-phosphate cytidylyltransferase
MRVLTLGTFDLFHAGHVELLEACRALAGDGGWVMAAVNTDEFVESFKGKRPVVDLEGRADVVYACRHVDDVYLNGGGKEQVDIISSAKPDIIAVGDDWQDRDYLGQLGVTQDWLDERGIRIVYVPRTTGRSTTRIRQAASA